MVRLQTLDLRIGVRVPASQPNILQHFLKILRSTPPKTLSRIVAVRAICKLIHKGNVCAGSQMTFGFTGPIPVARDAGPHQDQLPGALLKQPSFAIDF
jgi:hypothetical protein